MREFFGSLIFFAILFGLLTTCLQHYPEIVDDALGIPQNERPYGHDNR